MHASIQRYSVSFDSAADSLADLGWRLNTLLAPLGGFVASMAIADESGALITINLFDDGASLAAATQSLYDQTRRAAGNLRAREIARGEVVAQKGL
jgi:hypothetical protein